MKNTGLAILLFICFFLGGCATQNKPMYYWDGYSQSLYKYKKNNNNETLEFHKKTLLGIIQTSKEKELRVPPGIYCEYGYFLIKEGKQEEGMKYIALEEQTYPESQVFIQRLQGRIVEPKESK
jgi:hypothetical protein